MYDVRLADVYDHVQIPIVLNVPTEQIFASRSNEFLFNQYITYPNGACSLKMEVLPVEPNSRPKLCFLIF